MSISQRRRLRLRCSVTCYVQLLMGDLGFYSISPSEPWRVLDMAEDCVGLNETARVCVSMPGLKGSVLIQ